jgi:hypothetical protein
LAEHRIPVSKNILVSYVEKIHEIHEALIDATFERGESDGTSA